jgi:hypothetical protein
VTIAKGVEGISFPSKFYSSLAVGKPVLALSEPGSELQRMVEDTESGLWSPIGDVDSLLANISLLRRDPGRAERFGVSARSAMLSRFTIQASASEYLRVVDRAAEEACGSRGP